MKKVTAVVLGCGNRGQAYADYALHNPEELEIIGVIDISKQALDWAQQKYAVREDMAFLSLDEFLKKNIPCDLIINATMDSAHYQTAMKILQAGYNLLLEKPVTAVPSELLDIKNLAAEKGLKVVICHVLRYTPYFRKIKEILMSGQIGDIITIEANEHVWISHFIESYVRGPWCSEDECGSGFLLAKSCHDLDMVCWLNNKTTPKSVVSFGNRGLFIPKNAPEGATEFCYNCPYEKTCLYSAIKLHLDFAPMAFQTYAELIKKSGKNLTELTREDKLEYLKTSKYGRCAYENKNLMDRQSILIDFEDGSIASFTMVGGSAKPDRYIHICGTKGEIEGKIGDNKFILRTMDRSKGNYRYLEETVDVSAYVHENHYAGHAGGDFGIMYDLIRYFNGETDNVSLTTIDDSISGHFCVYEAEESRKTGRIVDYKEFLEKYEK